MLVRYRTPFEFERQPVVDPISPPKNNAFELRQQTNFSSPKHVHFKRRIPPEIFNDLPESSVDPPGEVFSSEAVSGEGSSSVVRYGERAITVIGCPRRTFENRSKSLDYYDEGNLQDADVVNHSHKSSQQPRSLVCQECSRGTFFGLYHTPASSTTFQSLPTKHSNGRVWDLPAHSTFSPPPPLKPPDPSGAKTFHPTPEIRYKPVFFGDPRFRRYSYGYCTDRRRSANLQDFCQTMLSAPDMPIQIETAQVHSDTINEDAGMTTDLTNAHQNNDGTHRTPKKNGKPPTPLRSPKLVKEVLKRMSSHPSGRGPQIPETFSDEEDPFCVDSEAMKVIDAFEKSLIDFNPKSGVTPSQPVTEITPQKTEPSLIQSDNLVEEVLLSDRKYEKSSTMQFGEKFNGREEMEDSRRFMSLTKDSHQKTSRNQRFRGESPAPPKPPRNYDSLPRGFKTSNGSLHYDTFSSSIHPLLNCHSLDAGYKTSSQCSSSPQQNYFVVVAIDFGTTYSGYAFSFTQDSENIHMMRKWEGGDPGVINQKTPTTLLLDPDEKFHSFGYAARDCYHDLDPQEAKKWLYFEKFKMTLHKTEHLSRETMISAANGKPVPALYVFAHALRYFREHALQELSDQSATTILNEDVRWVVTVPAIWRQQAKQFMRSAAYQAGIASKENPEQLLIALEPEAASIFCRRLKQHQLVSMVSNPQRLSVPNIAEFPERNLEPAVIENAGTRYMVVDCGGGTVDITVHEITDENGTIKELHKASGGPYGSVGIDMEFEKLLENIFGADFMEQFKLKRPAAYVDLMVAFEARKRNATPFKITPINVALPFSFIDYYKKTKNSSVEAAVKKYGNKEIRWSSQGMLRIEPSGMMNLFQPTLDAIRMHVANVLSGCEVGNINYLFLVGGFSESAILQKSIRDTFSDKLKVIIPQGVSLAILKGAVQFGVDPTVVSSRRSRLTYGVGVLNRFIHGTHPVEKLVVKDGVEWCADIFDKFVLSDQSVCVGDTVIRRYTPARSGQACSVIHVYCSERDDVCFITDTGVKRCGTLVLDLPEEIEVKPQNKREIQTIMIFGDTELKVSAMDVLTGKCVKAEVDFLNA